MLAGLLDRVLPREARPVRPDAGVADPDRRVVAAFKHRAHAERAVGALLDMGLAADQIRLEGPADLLGEPTWRDTRSVRSDPAERAAWAALLGAAAWSVAPTGRPGWLLGMLGLPVLATSLLAGLTAAANPAGLELFRWTVIVAAQERLTDVGGLLRAFGGRGVYLSQAAS
jgi:hypothetical protein